MPQHIDKGGHRILEDESDTNHRNIGNHLPHSLSFTSQKSGSPSIQHTRTNTVRTAHNLMQILPITSFKCSLKYNPGCFSKGKGKSVPLQAWSDPEGSRKLRFPNYMTTAQGVGKVVSLTHRPPLPPGNAPGTHFC